MVALEAPMGQQPADFIYPWISVFVRGSKNRSLQIPRSDCAYNALLFVTLSDSHSVQFGGGGDNTYVVFLAFESTSQVFSTYGSSLYHATTEPDAKMYKRCGMATKSNPSEKQGKTTRTMFLFGLQKGIMCGLQKVNGTLLLLKVLLGD